MGCAENMRRISYAVYKGMHLRGSTKSSRSTYNNRKHNLGIHSSEQFNL